jgi:hypothetical protein
LWARLQVCRLGSRSAAVHQACPNACRHTRDFLHRRRLPASSRLKILGRTCANFAGLTNVTSLRVVYSATFSFARHVDVLVWSLGAMPLWSVRQCPLQHECSWQSWKNAWVKSYDSEDFAATVQAYSWCKCHKRGYSAALPRCSNQNPIDPHEQGLASLPE